MPVLEHREETHAAVAPAVEGDVLYEVIDGKVVEMPKMGAFEAELAFLLATWIDALARPRGLGRAVTEALFDLAPAVNRQRRPDAAFVSAERWPLRRRAPKAAAWKIAPDLAIEVVSPSNTVLEMAAKIADYFAAGVRRVWVVVPEPQQVHDYASPTSVTILTRADRLDGGEVLPGFGVDLAAYFGEPDEPA
jgi:Uma2 family endonuclease